MALFKTDKKTTVKKTAVDKPTTMKDMYAGETKSKTGNAKAKSGASVSQAYRILLRPLVSEKASRQQSSNNQYFFAVAKNANKVEIAKAVATAYGVKAIKVNVSRIDGKSRMYGKYVGKRKDWKKAVVTLAKGKTIALYEGV